jgi:hypothetical protein
MVATAQPRLALACVDRLRAPGRLDDHLDPVSARALVAALLRPESEGIPNAVVDLIAERRPKGMRAALGAALEARSDESPPAILLAALGALDGNLDDAMALQMLESSSEAHRLAAARYASGAKALVHLRDLARTDPVPDVRAAAITRLVALEQAAAMTDAIRGLEDEMPMVRGAAARALASLDPVSIPELEYAVETGSALLARSAIGALSMMGTEAHIVLVGYAESHTDDAIRMLARIAVGAPIGHRD